ncbi:MAG: hypothetical protein IPM79_09140 [Polyangiaceae bacterium]|nr:hypothetical protein [Polyangiaceae bacterium]
MSAPTDLELMMYFDGELDEPRASEVRAFVEGSARARQKLDGLSLVGVAVEERARARESSFPDLTDSIMARVSAEAAGRTADAQEPHADRAPEAPPVRPKPLDTPKKLEIAAPAANDNGRLIFGLAAFAAVAAAALFMWGRSTSQRRRSPRAPRQSSRPSTPRSRPGRRRSDLVPASESPPSAPEDEAPPPSAEVAAVDFGSRNGMVYYVAVANQPTTTTVVWVRDE